MDGRTDERRDRRNRIVSISRVSVLLTRDENLRRGCWDELVSLKVTFTGFTRIHSHCCYILLITSIVLRHFIPLDRPKSCVFTSSLHFTDSKRACTRFIQLVCMTTRYVCRKRSRIYLQRFALYFFTLWKIPKLI